MQDERYLPVLGRHALMGSMGAGATRVYCPPGVPVFAVADGHLTAPAPGQRVLRAVASGLVVVYHGLDPSGTVATGGELVQAGSPLGWAGGTEPLVLEAHSIDGIPLDLSRQLTGATDPATTWTVGVPTWRPAVPSAGPRSTPAPLPPVAPVPPAAPSGPAAPVPPATPSPPAGRPAPPAEPPSEDPAGGQLATRQPRPVRRPRRRQP